MGINKQYELVYSNSMKINMGDYEQLNPFYSSKLIIEGDVDIAEEMEHLRSIVDAELLKNVSNIKNAKKAKEASNFHFYDKDGLKYISVTSVLSEPKTPEEEERLKPYGARGTALHRVFAHLISNGELVGFTEEEKKACASIGGFEGYDFWFKDDLRFDFSLSEITVYNDEHMFAGRYDANGFFELGDALFDLKTGNLDKKSTEKAFMQLAAYNIACNNSAEKLVIIPLGPKNKKQPIVAMGEDIKRYTEMFLQKRKQFKDKYGV